MREPTTEQFLKDVANHSLTVKLDNGVYRHLRFSQPQNSHLWFELVTWPGVLTIHGDMGTWTFSRVEDMFTFFRSRKLEINPHYWSEKLQAGPHSGHRTAKVFDSDLFDKEILDLAKQHFEDEDSEEDRKRPPEVLEGLINAIKEEVLREESFHEKMFAARDFSYDIPDHVYADGDCLRKGYKFTFDMCEFPDGHVFGYHFLWCCYAIVWGIQQSDAANSERVA